MGMLIYDALILAKVAGQLPNRGRVLTLGVPTLNFSEAEFAAEVGARPKLFEAEDRVQISFGDYAGFFRSLGFPEIDALDISEYEGANIIGDLNDGGLSEKISHRYELIYDSGTIEHIFDAPTALRTLNSLMKVGGIVVHATPANGFMDHGLWQISPDLLRSFYRVAGYEILTSALFNLGEKRWALPAETNLYRTRGRRYIAQVAPEVIAMFAAKKIEDRTNISIRMQDYYEAMHESKVVDDESSFFIEYGTIPTTVSG